MNANNLFFFNIKNSYDHPILNDFFAISNHFEVLDFNYFNLDYLLLDNDYTFFIENEAYEFEELEELQSAPLDYFKLNFLLNFDKNYVKPINFPKNLFYSQIKNKMN